MRVRALRFFVFVKPGRQNEISEDHLPVQTIMPMLPILRHLRGFARASDRDEITSTLFIANVAMPL
jgi:hypothetical protein